VEGAQTAGGCTAATALGTALAPPKAGTPPWMSFNPSRNSPIGLLEISLPLCPPCCARRMRGATTGGRGVKAKHAPPPTLLPRTSDQQQQAAARQKSKRCSTQQQGTKMQLSLLLQIPCTAMVGRCQGSSLLTSNSLRNRTSSSNSSSSRLTSGSSSLDTGSQQAASRALPQSRTLQGVGPVAVGGPWS